MPQVEPLDMGSLDQLVGYQLRRAFLRSNQAFARLAGRVGLAPGQYGVLCLVLRNPGRSQAAIAAAAGLDRSSLAQMLDQLAGKGWVERRPGPDRRTFGLHITPAGADAVTAAEALIKEHEKFVCSELNAGERAMLLDLLQRLGC